MDNKDYLILTKGRAVCLAPNAAAPKVFMKYFFVNTKTGEISGEMLTLVRLDEDAPVEGE